MTFFNDTRRAGGVSTYFSGVFASIRDALVYRRAFLATRGELEGLSRREMDDLGISPAQISDIAHSAAEEAVARKR